MMRILMVCCLPEFDRAEVSVVAEHVPLNYHELRLQHADVAQGNIRGSYSVAVAAIEHFRSYVVVLAKPQLRGLRWAGLVSQKY
jgi:hypothetical protein